MWMDLDQGELLFKAALLYFQSGGLWGVPLYFNIQRQNTKSCDFFFSGFPVHFYRNLWCVICLCCTGLCMILTVQTLLAASHVCKLLKLKFCLRQSDSAVPTILCPRHSSSFKTKAMLGKSVFHSLSHFDSIRFRCNIERDSALWSVCLSGTS